jgi:ubiquitin C-terminal hydrolase/Ca2+-binding EF-hand superfamily protein
MGARITLLDRFGSTQAKLLLDIFNKYSSKSGLDLRSFQRLFPQLSEFPSSILSSVFKIFDLDQLNLISFSNFCVTVSQYLVGHRVEKCKFLFRVFDLNGNGIIESKELAEFKKYMKKVLRQNDAVYSRAEAEKSIEVLKRISLEDFVKWSYDYLDFHKALIPFEVIPSPNSEKDIIHGLLLEQMVEGDTWYLISTPWLETWKNYVNFDKSDTGFEDNFQGLTNMRSKSILPGSRPVEISNVEIQNPDCPEHIREDCKCPEDCTPIHNKAWKELVSWYGGGPEFPRTVIRTKQGTLDLEWFPVVLHVHVSSHDLRTLVVSRTRYVSNVLQLISESQTGRLYWVSEKGLQLLKSEKILSTYFSQSKVVKCVFQETGQDEGTPLLKEFIEVNQEFQFNLGQNIEYEEDGQWLSGFIKEITEDEYIIGAGWRSKTVKIQKTDSFRIRKPSRNLITSSRTTNATGLVNLGNTCYMNSILQCLNNTPLLSKFFALNSYARLVNKKNPESSQGEICRVFGNLLRNLSSVSYSRVRPYEFYETFSQIFTLFQGNEQQDAHEFLRMLLDSLHEDLNRQEGVKTSKTITLNDPAIELERQTSQEHWQKIQGNIGSVISDLCGGQSRNRIACKQCNSQVVIFEMFMDLSLPIPIASPEVSVCINFFDRSLGSCIKIKFNLTQNAGSSTLLQKIEKETEFKSEDLKFFIYTSKVLQEIRPEDLSNHLKTDLFAYEILKNLEDFQRPEKITSDWRESLKPGDLIDFNTGNYWVTARICDVLKKEFEILIQEKQGEYLKIDKKSPLLAFYHSETLKSGSIIYSKVYNKRMIHKELEIFGLPLFLSLGSWMSFKDLRDFLENLTYDYSGISRLGDFVKFLVWTEDHICAICLKENCSGCGLPDTFDLVSSLSTNFYIVILWKSFIMYKPKIIEHQEMEDISIYKCLQEYNIEENIEFTCNKCNTKDSLSKTSICKLPDLLIIHLKRFRFEGNNPIKINNKIDFPLNNFDLNVVFNESSTNYDYTQSKAKDNNFYDLFAVVNHSGNVFGGHYTCSCLVENGLQKKWLYYDDEHVYELQGNVENEIITRKAYILFYRRQRMSSSSLIQLSNYVN